MQHSCNPPPLHSASTAAPKQESSTPSLPVVAIVFGSHGETVVISDPSPSLFRGDLRPPSEIFEQGFQAKGRNTDLKGYAEGLTLMGKKANSAYVASTADFEIAKAYATIPPTGYVYELHHVQGPDGPIKVSSALLVEYQEGKLSSTVYKWACAEQDHAWRTIATENIKGVYPLVQTSSGHWRQADFIPNPHYTPPSGTTQNNSGSPSMTTAVMKDIGRIFTGVAAIVDGMALTHAYQKSQQSPDYRIFFTEAARVVGSWIGAITAGNMMATVATGAAALLGPVPAVMTRIATGVGGSVWGGMTLGSLSQESMQKIYARSDLPKPIASAPPLPPYRTAANALINQRIFESIFKTDSQSVKEAIRDAMSLVTRSCPDAQAIRQAFARAERTLGPGLFLSLQEFCSVLHLTGLISSYNTMHPFRPIDMMGRAGFTGGIEQEVALISNLRNSAAHALHEIFYLCFPVQGPPLDEAIYHQLFYEIWSAYTEHGTFPLFSLHFNEQGSLYSVLHPAFRHTLCGEVIAMLDNLLKGAVNGFVYPVDFLRNWHQNPITDPALLAQKAQSLKEHFRNTFQKKFQSLREMISRAGLNEMDRATDPHTHYRQEFEGAFRVISKMNRIERVNHNILLFKPDFEIEHDLLPNPDQRSVLNEYFKTHGHYPKNYQHLMDVYKQFSHILKSILPQIPQASFYLHLLSVINALCYVSMTFDKMGLKPDIQAPKGRGKNSPYYVPNTFPPIPILYFKTVHIQISQKDFFQQLKKESKDFQNLQNWISSFQDALSINSFSQDLKEACQKTISLCLRSQFAAHCLDEHDPVNPEELESCTQKLIQSLVSMQAAFSAQMTENIDACKQAVLHSITISGPLLSQIESLIHYFSNLQRNPTYREYALVYVRAISALKEALNNPLPYLLDAEELSAEYLCTEYTHVSKTPIGTDSIHISGGVGLNLDRSETRGMPIPTAEALISHIEQTIQQAKEKSDVHMNGQSYDICRISFMKKDLNPRPASPDEEDADRPSRDLFEAAFLGEVDFISSYLGNIDEKNEQGLTALMVAVGAKQRDCVSALLRAGANINVTGGHGLFPLYVAIMQHDIEMALLLLTYPQIDLEGQLDTQSTPLMLAIEEGLEVVARTLIEKGACLSKRRLQDGYTPIHLAASGHCVALLECMRQKNADLQAPSSDGMTPLHAAMDAGQAESAAYLISKTESHHPYNFQGDTPVMMAIMRRHTHLTPLLLECLKEYPLDYKNKRGQSLLDLATLYHMQDLVDFLQSSQYMQDKEPINPEGHLKPHRLELAIVFGNKNDVESFIKADKIPTKDLLPLLEKAVFHAHPALVKMLATLIPRHIVSTHLFSGGQTLLHLATLSGDRSIVKTALDLGCTLKPDDSNRTPLDLAIDYDDLDMADTLLKPFSCPDWPKKVYIHAHRAAQLHIEKWLRAHDLIPTCHTIQDITEHSQALIKALEQSTFTEFEAWIKQYGVNHKIHKGKTALMLIAELGNHLWLEYLLKKEHLHLYARDRYGRTALHYAILGGFLEISCLFLAKMKNTIIRDHTGKTPLMLAAKKGLPLPILPAELSLYDNQGFQAIHYAAMHGHVAFVEACLKNGADIHSETRTDLQETALYLAARYGQKKMWDALDHLGADRYKQNKAGQTSLTAAILSQNRVLIDFVMRVFSVSPFKNVFWQETVLAAAMANDRNLINEWTLCQAPLFIKNPQTGETPLHMAAEYESAEVLNTLLSFIPVETTDDDGNTALHVAARVGSVRIAQLLIAAGAQLLTCNRQKRSPLALAKEYSPHAVYPILLAQYRANELSLKKSTLATIPRHQSLYTPPATSSFLVTESVYLPSQTILEKPLIGHQNKELMSHIIETTEKLYHISLNTAQRLALDLSTKPLASSHKGKMLEMKTGEGKSIVIAILATFYACQGQAVDVITSNESLAERDLNRFEKLFHSFGLQAKAINKKATQDDFKAHILYGTNTDFEFATLRENLYPEQVLRGKRPYTKAIIDEADNLLIDNAIHSALIGVPADHDYRFIFPILIDCIKEQGPFNKLSINMLREALAEWALLEDRIHLPTLNDVQLECWIESAYAACFEHLLNTSYILEHCWEDGKKVKKITIVDHARTGQKNEGSRWSKGLHQCLEALHDCPITEEMWSGATTTHHAYFSGYESLLCLTGTIGSLADQDEIKKLYHLEIMPIAPDRPSQFERQATLITWDNLDQFLLEKIKPIQEQGRPILILCQTIRAARDLSTFFHQNSLEHLLFDGTQQLSEEYMLAQAGQAGQLLIATNNAGRGTDIVLSQESIDKGGLHVIFTFYPDNLRVEEQGFGRAARQGQPGSGCMILHGPSLNLDQSWLSTPQALAQLSVQREHHQSILRAKRAEMISGLAEILTKQQQFFSSLKTCASPQECKVLRRAWIETLNRELQAKAPPPNPRPESPPPNPGSPSPSRRLLP